MNGRELNCHARSGEAVANHTLGQTNVGRHATRIVMEVRKVTAMQMKRQRPDLLERRMPPEHGHQWCNLPE